MKLPGWLKEQGLSDFCGVLWLFKTFEAPKGAEEETGLLRLTWQTVTRYSSTEYWWEKPPIVIRQGVTRCQKVC